MKDYVIFIILMILLTLFLSITFLDESDLHVDNERNSPTILIMPKGKLLILP